MAETLTPEEQAFIDKNKDLLSGTSLGVSEEPETEPETAPEIDPDLEALLKRNPNIDLTNTSLDPNNSLDPARTTGTGFATDFTPQAQVASDATDRRDSMTFPSLYGEKPEIGTFQRVRAALGVGSDLEGDQAAMEAYEADLAEFKTKAAETYETTGHQSGNDRIYTKYLPIKDDEGNVTDYKQVDVIIPKPDSTSFERVVEQAGRDIYQQLGGFVKEGAILEESDLEQAVPDYELTGGEQFFTTMLSIVAPVVPAIKGLNYAGKFVRGAKFGTKSAIGVDAVGTAAIEAIMSREADKGLLVRPDSIAALTGSRFTDEQNKDISMFMDGLLVNGALDGLISVVGKAAGWGKQKVSASALLASEDALRAAVTDDMVTNVMKFLDPELADLGPTEFKSRILNLSEKLNDNAIIELTLGKATTEIGVDTTNAIMRSSEAYIAETRQGLRDTMSDTEFDEYVKTKAAEMSRAMIDLMRSQSTNPAVANTAARVTQDVGDFVADAGQAQLRDGVDGIDAAAAQTAESLVFQSNREVADIEKTAALRASQTDDLLATQKTLIEDNPILQTLVGDELGLLVTGNQPVFTANVQQYRDAVNELVTDKVYPQFVKDMDEVDAAYLNLPEADIDAKALKKKLFEVVQDVNDIDSGGADIAANVLRDMFDGYKPKTVSTRPDPIPIVGQDDLLKTSETSSEVIERITENIKFSDLYRVKADLQRVIEKYSNQPAVQQRLMAFRKHITDAEEGGQMAYVIANADPEDAAQFAAADDLYKAARAKYTNSEPLERLKEAMADKRRFSETDIPGPAGRKDPDFQLAAGQFIDETMADSTGTLYKQLNYMLDGVVNPKQISNTFAEMFMANATDALRVAVAQSDNAADPEKALLAAFQPIRDQMQAVGADELLRLLETGYRQVRDGFRESGNFVANNDKLIKALDAQAKAAQEGILSTLISSTPGRAVGLMGRTEAMPTSSAREALETIITGKDSVNKLKELKTKIDGLPSVLEREMAMEALQAISLDTIGRKIFGVGATGLSGGTTATRSIRNNNVVKLTSDEASDLMKSIDTLYPANLEMSEAIFQTMDKLFEVTLPGRVKSSMPGSDTAFNTSRNQQIRDSVSTSILLLAGYMNPTAAMLRRIAEAPMKEAQQLEKDVAANVLAVIVTSPKAFSDLLKASAEGQKQSVINELAKQAIRNTAKTTRYEIRVQESDEYGQEDPAAFADRDMTEIFGADEVLGIQ